MFVYHILYLSSLVLAKPVVRRYIDLDGNGLPDFCVPNQDGSSNCIENGAWTKVIPTPTTSPTSTMDLSGTAISTPASTTAAAAAAATATTIATGAQLPLPNQFKQDKGIKWNIEYVGDIQFTGALAAKNVNGDKCRTSKLGDQIIWNCGDMMCGTDFETCGFAMGPSFYGTDSVMTINTDQVSLLNDNDFVKPWIGDSTPEAPQSNWGMDTSNVAAINDTHGVAYAWEIWRGASDGSISDRGNAVALVTLGQEKPLAQRLGPLLTGPDAIQLGLLAILRDGQYIYIYSAGGPSKLIVSRVVAGDDVFDPNKYESLEHGTNSWTTGIPKASDTQYGMETANSDGQFGCAVYGSIFYNNYLKKYTIICSIFQSFVNMYASDTPYGPWSSEYSLLTGWNGYGSMAHPDYSPGGSHKEFYFSQGPNTKFNMFKVTFDY